MIDVTPDCTSTDMGDLFVGINVDVIHRREVDHEAVVTDGFARDVVSAAFDREQQILIAGEIDGSDDVGSPRTLGDDCWLLVDHPVPHAAGLVVALVLRLENRPADVVAECFECRFTELGCCSHGISPS
jgi:hypothetical protein